MKIIEIGDDDIMIELDVREHTALSDAFCMLMSSLEPCAVEAALGWTVDQAYEFGYSVYLDEAVARLNGNSWLQTPSCSDSLAVDIGGHPVLQISFSESGSLWRVDARQAQFIARCMDVARRMKAAGTLDSARDERVFDLVG